MPASQYPRLRALAFGAALLAAPGRPVLAAEPPRNVLVLYSNGRLLPANVEVDRGLRSAIPTSADRPRAVFDEFLDAPQFSGPAHERTIFTYLTEKYATRPPDVLVAGNDEALSFLLRNRPALFPRIPIVHVVASRKVLQALSPLPPDVIRVPMDVDFSRTIEQALRLHPKARRLVIVTGTAPQDRSFEAQLRKDVGRFGNRVQPEFLSGLSTSVLLKRLAGLKADAVVFTPGLFQDGDGRSFLPREAVRAIAAAASVPVYAPFNTYLGTGIVGGCMTSTEAMGRDAGEIASRLLDGTAPGSLGLTEPKPAPRLPTA